MESQSASVWVPSRELAALSLPVNQLACSRVLFRASLQCFVLKTNRAAWPLTQFDFVSLDWSRLGGSLLFEVDLIGAALVVVRFLRLARSEPLDPAWW